MIVEDEVCPPLVPNFGQPGWPCDHNIIVITALLPRSRNFKWMRYSNRKYTEAWDKAFGDWISNHDWSEIQGDPSDMVKSLGATLDQAMLVFFPLITRRLRSDQDPWVNIALEKMIKCRNKLFKLQGRSKSWKKVKKRTGEIIKERKRGYLGYQVEKVQEKDGLAITLLPSQSPSSVSTRPQTLTSRGSILQVCPTWRLRRNAPIISVQSAMSFFRWI